jgi:hypothetical protein
MRNSQVNILAVIATAILRASRQRGATVRDWYISDCDYEVFAETAQNLCGDTTMKICGASIHRSSSVPDLPHDNRQAASIGKSDQETV